MINAVHLNGIKFHYTNLDDVLENIKEIKVLVFSSFYLGDEGAKLLAQSLENNTTLEQLTLFQNQIGDEGANSLAKSLANNTTLQILSFYCHDLNTARADLIKNYLLKTNYTLRMYNGDFFIRNFNYISYVADALINKTKNQTVLYAFIEVYKNVMYDYLINVKNQSPEQAQYLINHAKMHYNPAKLLFGSVAKQISFMPEDIKKLIAEEALPKGNNAISWIIDKFDQYDNLLPVEITSDKSPKISKDSYVNSEISNKQILALIIFAALVTIFCVTLLISKIVFPVYIIFGFGLCLLSASLILQNLIYKNTLPPTVSENYEIIKNYSANQTVELNSEFRSAKKNSDFEIFIP